MTTITLADGTEFVVNNDNTAGHPRWELDAWKAEATRLGGGDLRVVRFVCPMCEQTASATDWRDIPGLLDDDRHNRAPHECLGRGINETLTASSPKLHKTSNDSKYCDWTASGLFQGPVSVHNPETGKIIPAFRFADDQPVDS